MCKHSDTVTSLFISLSHQKLPTHVLKANMSPLSTCQRLARTPPTEQLPFKVSFNWLLLSPGWELCLTADTLMVYHGSCALNMQFSIVTKGLQHIQYPSCVPVPCGWPQRKLHQAITPYYQSGVTITKYVVLGFLSFFKHYLVLSGTETT